MLETKAASAIVSILVLASMLTLGFEVHLTAAEPGTIIVPDDYSTIQQAVNAAGPGDTVYVRAGTYYEHIVVEKTLSVVGESKSATIIDGSETGTVVSVTANNALISNFTIRRSGGSPGAGIKVQASFTNITNNIITGNFRGVYLDSGASMSKLRNNTILGNRFNFGVFNELAVPGFGRFDQDIDISNTVDGKPIYYLIDQSNLTIPSDAGYVALIRCKNITIANLDLKNNWQGIMLYWTENSTILRNNITDNYAANVYIFASSNNRIDSNNITGAADSGVLLRGSRNNTVIENNIANNNAWGAFLEGSEDNSILSNSIADNFLAGVFLYTSSRYNTLSLNNIARNFVGIRIWTESSYNSLHHNNLVNSDFKHVSMDLSTNTWDDGYPSGGNYWSDYSGVDWYKGPYQNETESDGLGDTPHVINAYNVDKYPLMKPYPWDPHDIGITRIASKTIVGQGLTLPLNVTIFNYGTYAETFNLTVYANDTIIKTLANITLTSRNSTTLTFSWNTSGFVKGNYTITAYTSPIPNETNAADNTLTTGLIVSHLGDVDGDMKVDGKDIAIVAKAFGTLRGQQGYETNADINNDGKIDGKDIAIAAKYFGTVDP